MNALAGTIARLLLVVCLLFFFLVGFFVGGVGLHDPDTCWLLALGRYMFEHMSLPPTDPFSWTFASIEQHEGRQFIMYQWLAELIFYAAYKVGNLAGLLMFASLILLNAFLLIPIRCAVKCGAAFSLAIVGAILAVMAGSFHFLVRPEIFSYLFLVLLLWFLAVLEPKNSTLAPGDSPQAPGDSPQAPIDSPQEPQPTSSGRTLSTGYALAAVFIVMTLWANMHTGFICGVVVLFARPVLHFLEWIIWEKPHFPRIDVIKWGGKACLLGVSATLLTPWGIKLWQYIPHLFFLPINNRIIELRPLSTKDFTEYTYYPFLLIAVIAVVVQLLAVRARLVSTQEVLASRQEELASHRHIPNRHWNQLYGPISVIGWLIAGFSCRRLIPFAGLVLLAEALPLVPLIIRLPHRAPSDSIALHKIGSRMEGVRQLLGRVEQHLHALVNPTSFMWFVTSCILCLFGGYLVTFRIVPPEIPQSSKVFPMPAGAVEFIREHPPSGRMFNDPQYGDVLIWHLQPAPKVFIDTRFDMYGADHVRLFEAIVTCKEGWAELLDRQKIDWVFLPLKAPLVAELHNTPGWEEAYRDNVATVIVRRQ